MIECNVHFPFAAVCDQQQYKLALILNIIDPAIGGVLVSGPRGIAKSTLARASADLLPQSSDQTAQFVTLPLGSTEDMLTGSLDLEQVLNDKKFSFKPGLFHKAHQGVLYVDEVNLLSDHLVDLMLDVSASKINVVERDGLSHQHESRFILMGTMNPDEGELRPQLLDRFGLMVVLNDIEDQTQRVEIIKRRLAFDANPHGFIRQFDQETALLKNNIIKARQQLNQIKLPELCLDKVTTLCLAAKVEGVRADLVMTRAAIAYCAYQGRLTVTNDDIETIAPMVLAHRAKLNQSSPPPPPKPEFQRPQSQQHKQNDGTQSQPEGEFGQMPPVTVKMTPKSMALSLKTANDRQSEKQTAYGKNAGFQIMGSGKLVQSQKLDLYQSLLSDPLNWPPKHPIHKKQRRSGTSLHCFLLDTSASTLKSGILAEAKGLVSSLLEKVYLLRDQCCLMTFGNDQIEWVFPIGQVQKDRDAKINGIKAGGGTPLKLALSAMQKKVAHFLVKSPHCQVIHYILTDGRTNDDLQGISLAGKTVVIDTNENPLAGSQMQILLNTLQANYLKLRG